MGIYIKHMKMPNSCVECPLYKESACDAFETLAPYTFKDNERASFCPLMEVAEPHGRLMELDKLEKFLQQNGYQYERIELQGGIGEDRHQIKVFDEENGKELFDVICQRGSFGYEEGLLEAMGSIVNEKEIGDRVEGYLTADEIIRRITK